MLNRTLEIIRSSGSSSPKRDLVGAIGIALVAGGVAQEWLRVPALSLAVTVGVLALEYEFALRLSGRRQKSIQDSWPIVLESLESAAISGMSILESLRDLAESEQLMVSKEFDICCREIDSGIGLEEALTRLKQRLSNAAADFTIELIKMTNAFGSAGYVAALRNQSKSLRMDSILKAELDAKQGWVVGTAKLAVAAPWLIVCVLAIRPENAFTYGSSLGTIILLIGLAASAVALRIVYRIASSSTVSRVFA